MTRREVCSYAGSVGPVEPGTLGQQPPGPARWEPAPALHPALPFASATLSTNASHAASLRPPTALTPTNLTSPPVSLRVSCWSSAAGHWPRISPLLLGSLQPYVDQTLCLDGKKKRRGNHSLLVVNPLRKKREQCSSEHLTSCRAEALPVWKDSSWEKREDGDSGVAL